MKKPIDVDLLRQILLTANNDLKEKYGVECCYPTDDQSILRINELLTADMDPTDDDLKKGINKDGLLDIRLLMSVADGSAQAVADFITSSINDLRRYRYSV